MSGEKVVMAEALAGLRSEAARGSFELDLIRQSGQDGIWEDFPPGVHPRVVDAFRNMGMARPYRHQAQAISAGLEGRDLVVATPTASGKTLIYNTLALNALCRDALARSLYLFPTKALAQDQMGEVLGLLERLDGVAPAGVYDGDTPQKNRPILRKQAGIVLSNPYMLHSGILPHHTQWMGFLQNLRYVVLDELHVYTGVFGSHVANVIRRLLRICRFYGSSPVFLAASATIANPAELAERILGRPVLCVSESTAPRGERWLAFVNPPVVQRELGIRRSCLAVARQVAGILLERGLQTIAFANSRLHMEVLLTYLKHDLERFPERRGWIRGYRGGYLPAKRREIEREIREGVVRGVVSTNALELGIDIGRLDAVLLAGYPGSVASAWQRLGRAGRRQESSLGVLVATASPTNQFMAQHPEFFLDRSPESGRVNPDNLMILVDHIKCAAFELPFQKGDLFGGEPLEEILDHLAEAGLLHAREGRWIWTAEGYPAEAVSLQRISSDHFEVLEEGGNGRILAQVDFSAALQTLHPRAVYMLEGEPYLVDRLDFDHRKAFLVPAEGDYYTEAVSSSKVSVLDLWDHQQASFGRVMLGEVHVFSQVVGFKKIRFFTGENVGSGDLALPQQEFHTTAVWLIPGGEGWEAEGQERGLRERGLWALLRLLRSMAAVHLLCDIRDLGVALQEDPLGEDGGAESQERGFVPALFLYDNHPNGVGLSEALYQTWFSLFPLVLELVEHCPCPQGCPACVGPPEGMSRGHKAWCLEVLRYVCRQISQ